VRSPSAEADLCALQQREQSSRLAGEHWLQSTSSETARRTTAPQSHPQNDVQVASSSHKRRRGSRRLHSPCRALTNAVED
jgi:hypothetical protein